MSLKKLISWSETEFHELPWRKNRSLYRTLVSEIMLQQTTVSTVRNHFERFLIRFPNLDSLAQASEQDLLVAWKGLGYYRRARSLKKISEALAEDYSGKFPTELDELQKITGIGPYTASAIVSIGMDRPALAVDANLERVISRLYGIKILKGPKLQKEIQSLFQSGKIFPERNFSFRALNEALMDLGRTHCQARKASCALCFLKDECVAFNRGEPLNYPLVADQAIKKKQQEHELDLLRIFIIKKGKLLVYKKDASEWLSGQYEVPTFVITSTDKTFKQYPKLPQKIKSHPDLLYKTGITKYSIRNSIHLLDEKEFKKWKFERVVEWREISHEDANLSTATIKGLTHLRKYSPL